MHGKILNIFVYITSIGLTSFFVLTVVANLELSPKEKVAFGEMDKFASMEKNNIYSQHIKSFIKYRVKENKKGENRLENYIDRVNLDIIRANVILRLR